MEPEPAQNAENESAGANISSTNADNSGPELPETAEGNTLIDFTHGGSWTTTFVIDKDNWYPITNKSNGPKSQLKGLIRRDGVMVPTAKVKANILRDIAKPLLGDGIRSGTKEENAIQLVKMVEDFRRYGALQKPSSADGSTPLHRVVTYRFLRAAMCEDIKHKLHEPKLGLSREALDVGEKSGDSLSVALSEKYNSDDPELLTHLYTLPEWNGSAPSLEKEGDITAEQVSNNDTDVHFEINNRLLTCLLCFFYDGRQRRHGRRSLVNTMSAIPIGTPAATMVRSQFCNKSLMEVAHSTLEILTSLSRSMCLQRSICSISICLFVTTRIF
jgi:hypothetical protein